jgi:hypothetical protein
MADTKAATAQETDAAATTQQETAAPAGEGQQAGKTTDAEAKLLKEVMQLKRDLKAAKSANDAAETSKLTEQGEFKKLAEKATSRATALERSLINAELRAVAAQNGIIDLDIVRLVDQASLAIGDDGSITGAQEAIETLRASKPWAFAARADAAPPVVPGTATPGKSVTGGFKTYEDWKAAPADERNAWAAKHPQAFQSLAQRAMQRPPR